MYRIVIVFALGALLSACNTLSSASNAAPHALFLEGASVVVTDKTIGDHVVSFATGKNCSTVRRHLGRTYCEEDEIGFVDEVYCYRTLGKVDCYRIPAPHGELMRVGHAPTHAGPPR